MVFTSVLETLNKGWQRKTEDPDIKLVSLAEKKPRIKSITLIKVIQHEIKEFF